MGCYLELPSSVEIGPLLRQVLWAMAQGSQFFEVLVVGGSGGGSGVYVCVFLLPTSTRMAPSLVANIATTNIELQPTLLSSIHEGSGSKEVWITTVLAVVV